MSREVDLHARRQRNAEFRFYEELNDFLPAGRRRRSFVYRFAGTPSVKDAIEALGVPHTEVDVILVDGRSVSFEELLRGGERVAVYPRFERLDVSSLQRLRPAPLRETRFIADVHLGALARRLRLLGFDTRWSSDLEDERIIALSLAERRIILTRDRGILRNGRVSHGYWIRNTDPAAQLREVVKALDLGARLRPYTRCLECNGCLVPIAAGEAAATVPPRVLRKQHSFRRCTGCGRIYWPGSHLRRLERIVAEVQAATQD